MNKAYCLTVLIAVFTRCYRIEFAELFIEIGNALKATLHGNFINIVVGFAEQVAGSVASHLIYVFNKAGTAVFLKEPAE